MPHIDAALKLLQAGFSLVPVKTKLKTPLVKSWSEFQSRRMTEAEAAKHFSNGAGLAIVAGAVSGNIECLDFDLKAVFLDAWKSLVAARDPQLLQKVYVQSTQNGGVHVVYRAGAAPCGGMKIAHNAIKVPGPGKHQHYGKEYQALAHGPDWYIIPCAIETRGEGNYFLAAPTEGYTVRFGSLEALPVLSIEERQTLLDCAQALDEWSALCGVSKALTRKGKTPRNGETLPGDEYNEKADLRLLLKHYGWKPHGAPFLREGVEQQYYTRPGKDFGISATTFDNRALYIFSTNCPPLDAGRAYDAFGVFTAYEHDGDFADAAVFLSENGIQGTRGEAMTVDDAADALSWGVSSNEASEWPEKPTPLPDTLTVAETKVPELPLSMAPGPFRDWWGYFSSSSQIPLEYVAAGSIVGACGLLGRRLGIIPKAQDESWYVVPNVWGAIVGRPSKMKTSAISWATGPILRLENEAAQEFEATRFLADADVQEVAVKLKQAQKSLEKAVKDDDEAGIAGSKELIAALGEELATLEKERRGRRFVISDATTEAIGEILRYGHPGLICIRDELTGLMRTFERKGREDDRSFFLEGWDGKQGRFIDRIGRGSFFVPAVCLSLIGTFQPSKLQAYLHDALTGGVNDDGFMQRFQILMWPNEQDKKDWDYRDEEARRFEGVEKIHKAIANINPEEWGATDINGVPCIHFDSWGQEIYIAWLTALENRLRNSPDICNFPALESHLGKYRSLMPSLALMFHVVEGLHSGRRGGVTEEAARKAAAWCEFLELHARKVYSAPRAGDAGAVVGERALEGAKKLLGMILIGRIKDGHSCRDIMRENLTGLKTGDDLYSSIDLLEKYGWAKLSVRSTGKKVISIRPDIEKFKGAM